MSGLRMESNVPSAGGYGGETPPGVLQEVQARNHREYISISASALEPVPCIAVMRCVVLAFLFFLWGCLHGVETTPALRKARMPGTYKGGLL